jgi:hydrogenase-4 component F
LIILIPLLSLLTIITWAYGKNMFKILFIPSMNFDKTGIEKSNPYETLSHYLLLALVVYLGFFPPTTFVALIQTTIHSLPI